VPGQVLVPEQAARPEPDVEEVRLRVGPDRDTAFLVRLRPRPEPTAPVALVLPAMGVRARYYTAFADALWARGFSVVVTDLRGQGDSTTAADRRRRGGGSAGGYRDRMEIDLPAVAAVARERFPGAPLVVVGHSLGGQLSVLRAARGDDGLAGIALVGTGTAHWRDFGRRSAWVLVGAWIIVAVTRALGYCPGNLFGFGGRQPRALMLDWTRHSRTGRYRLAGYDQDLADLLGNVTLPVLAISLDADHLAPRRAVDRFARQLTGAAVTRIHLDRSSGTARLGHFDWAKEPGVIADHVARWTATLQPRHP